MFCREGGQGFRAHQGAKTGPVNQQQRHVLSCGHSSQPRPNGQAPKLLAGRRVPQADRAVIRPGGERGPAVQRQRRQACEVTFMSLQRAQELAARRVPKADRAVIRPGGERGPAVQRHRREAYDETFMSLQRAQELAARRVPQADRAVIRPGGERGPAVQRQWRETCDKTFMSLHRAQELAARRVPQADCAVIRPAGERGPAVQRQRREASDVNLCPSNARNGLPLAASHRRIVPSRDPAASAGRPSSVSARGL